MHMPVAFGGPLPSASTVSQSVVHTGSQDSSQVTVALAVHIASHST
jgi:hypothetical protein